MDVPNEEWAVYLNKRTGEMVTVTPEDEQLLEDPSATEDAADWQLEQLPKIRGALQSEDYIALSWKLKRLLSRGMMFVPQLHQTTGFGAV